MSSHTQHQSMQNFYNDSKETPLLDPHPKESNETKLESHFDFPPLTPQLLNLPLRQQSILLKECFLNKADPDNHFLWKLLNSQNYWYIIGSIYFQPLDQINFKQIENVRANNLPEDSKHEKKGSKLQPTNLQRSQNEDKIFIFQSRILASKNQSQSPESIDKIIEIWQNELQSTTNSIDTKFSLISRAIEDSKLQIQNLNEVMSPAVYRSDLVNFQYMEIQDIEARKGSQNVFKKIKSQVVCCVCNYEEIEDCVFMECKRCKSVIHDKCYSINLEMSEEEKREFMCWSCCHPDYENYNGMKCALCNLEGGVMGLSELDSNHELVLKKYHPQFIFSVQNHENEFVLKRKATDLNKITPFKARVHLSCAFWHSQCFFNRQSEQFEGLTKIKDKKWKTVCKVCGEINGAVIDCNFAGCSRSYHPQCARRSNIYMALIRIGKLSKQTFCQKHRIKYSYEKITEKRYDNIAVLKKLYTGLQRSLGYQGFSQKRERKNALKYSRSKKKIEDGEKKFCVCRQSDSTGSMIECEKCFEWFHFQCVKIRNVNNFICPFCKPKF